jgi:hypothetical protein
MPRSLALFVSVAIGQSSLWRTAFASSAFVPHPENQAHFNILSLENKILDLENI